MKIVQVINAMITNSDKITNVLKNNKEFFFLYNNKHKWSISKSDKGVFYLHLYPTTDMNIQELASFGDWENYNYVTYNSEEYKSQEATESFSELYKIVADKLLGVDSILDEILSDF